MDERIPAYLRAALSRHYGPMAEEIAGGFSSRRPVTLRVNRLKSDLQRVQAELKEAGLEWQPVDWYADALILPAAQEAQVQALPCYQNGEVYLQGLSAMLPALVMPLAPGAAVLDMAAAPGGKSCQMAALSGNRILLTACERDAVRAERLRFNLRRQGVQRAQVMQTDARQLDDAFRFDTVLLDAPCTGSGTLLLTEAPRRMEPAWVERVVRTQTALLRKALTLLKAGGAMVYATCSILREENEEVLRAVLPAFGATVTPFPAELAAGLPLLPVTLPGCLCVRPTALYEGFFVACVQKPR